ncbi:type II toxin-antitoxin system VapC family toxin [Jiella mangrovi]|uniref:Ribonuclease VapC n=1 Tax=Jiella mangrovi TaxID=2821407 RepID=A0ABS4BHA3_9HYPH|nr:type II toxin-antitoxin system VapC family toxin [Jiella mangrovi]MBP0615439.1 type II toxin-antitoxin system VapC family toxin [Jiella mangrovi]
MNGYLIDTNIISMLAPTKKVLSQSFVDWLKQAEGDELLFLSVVTLHEIERGIERLQLKGATAKAAELRGWLERVLASYADKILPVDHATAALSGKLEARAIGGGGNPGISDALIAGTAQRRGLVVITENSRDFAMFGISYLSPSELAST